MRDFGGPGPVRRLAASPVGVGFALAIMGLAIWIGLSILGGLGLQSGARLREAWDTSLYFYLGIPVMALAVAVAAFLHPERAWRWPLCLVVGHQAGVLLVGLGMQSGLSLIILTLILGVLLATVFAIPAIAGATAARRLTERVY